MHMWFNFNMRPCCACESIFMYTYTYPPGLPRSVRRRGGAWDTEGSIALALAAAGSNPHFSLRPGRVFRPCCRRPFSCAFCTRAGRRAAPWPCLGWSSARVSIFAAPFTRPSLVLRAGFDLAAGTLRALGLAAGLGFVRATACTIGAALMHTSASTSAGHVGSCTRTCCSRSFLPLNLPRRAFVVVSRSLTSTTRRQRFSSAALGLGLHRRSRARQAALLQSRVANSILGALGLRLRHF